MQIGSNKVDKVMIGTQEVSKVMLGGNEVHSSVVSCLPLPTDAANFIAEHISSEEQSLIASNPNGLYPTGPNMILGYYSSEVHLKPNTPDPKQAILDNGLTLVGPHYGDFQNSDGPNYQWARDNDKKVWYHIRPHSSGFDGGSNTWTDIARMMGTQSGRDYISAWCQTGIQYHVANNDDIVEGWYIGPDDWDGNQGSAAGYWDLVMAAINTYDPKKRNAHHAPNSFCSMGPLDTVCDHLSAGGYQNYITRGLLYDIRSRNPAGDCGRTDPLDMSIPFNKAQYRSQTSFIVSKMLEYSSDLYNGKAKPVVYIINDYNDPLHGQDPAYEHDVALAIKWQTHDFWCVIGSGAHGINTYSNAYYNTSQGQYTIPEQVNTLLGQYGILSNSGLQRALLWGDDKGSTDITVNSGRIDTMMGWHSSGSAVANRDWVCSHPSWIARNIQHGTNRFFVFVNSHPVDTVDYTIVNLPTEGLVLRDLSTGALHDLSSGQYSESIPSLGVRLYVIEPATGYCGGDEPQSAPVITSHPQSGSYIIGGVAPTLSVSYTPSNASVQWYWRNPLYGSDEWVAITATSTGGGVSTFQMKGPLVSEQNQDEFKVTITTSGNPSVDSNTALITVT